MKTRFIPCLIALLMATQLGNYTQAKPQEDPYYVKMKGFKIVSVGLKKIEFATTAVFYNTYNNKAKLTEVDIDVYADDQYLGKAINQEEVKIPKNSAFDIPLYFAVTPSANMIKSFTQVGTKITLGKKIKMRYIGYIKLKVIGFIPVKVKIDDVSYYDTRN